MLQMKTSDVMSDEEIIRLYWERIEQAIKETDIKYRKFLLSIAYNIICDTSDSEECLNDTYMDVWNTIPPSRPAKFQAFLATIIRRTAIDLYKRKKQQKRIRSELTVSLDEIEYLVSSNDVNSEIEAKELGKVISDFIRSLTERQMYVFMSRYYVARPIKEIAKLLTCSESTVNKEIAYIKSHMREKLEKEGYSI